MQHSSSLPGSAENQSLLLGVSLIIMGCASSAIGLAMMKRSTDVESALPLHLRWRWMIGFFNLAIFATVLNLISFGLLPLALISPFAGLTMVFSILLAATGLLHASERISYEQCRGCAIVLTGLTVVSLYGPHASGQGADTIAALLALFTAPPFVVFASVTVSTVAAYLWVLYAPSAAHFRPEPSSFVSTVCSAYAASVCGALSQLFLKVVSLACHEAVADEGPGLLIFLHPTVAVAFVGLALAAPLQLHLLNSTLASSPVSYAVPVYQALLTLLTTAAGGVFFSEFNRMSAQRTLVYAGGAAVSLSGLIVLGSAAQEAQAAGTSEGSQPLVFGYDSIENDPSSADEP